MIGDILEAAEFEANVAAYIAEHSGWDSEPCANGFRILCPGKHLKGRACGPWCKIREARLAVEMGWRSSGKTSDHRKLPLCEGCGTNFADIILPKKFTNGKYMDLCYPCAIERLLIERMK